jgi:DNA-binding Lrp family transcriptional regulator
MFDKLTENDKLILEYLFYDARLSTRDIATRIGIKQSSVHARIKKFEAEGFLRQYDSIPNVSCLPFIHIMYFCSISKELEEMLQIIPQCTGIQHTFDIYSHQIICFFNTESQIQDIEKLLPNNRIAIRITKSVQLGGSIFKKEIHKHTIKNNERQISLDKLDVKLLNRIIHGGAKLNLSKLALELQTTVAVLKYRKKQLIDNGYFVYFVSQPGPAFTSGKIAYHVFTLTENVSSKKILGLPNQVLAYFGEKQLVVIQFSLTFDDYLQNAKQLFSAIAPITQIVHTVFIDKPIFLNVFSEKLFFP